MAYQDDQGGGIPGIEHLSTEYEMMDENCQSVISQIPQEAESGLIKL